jgi:hypothetical protein
MKTRVVVVGLLALSLVTGSAAQDAAAHSGKRDKTLDFNLEYVVSSWNSYSSGFCDMVLSDGANSLYVSNEWLGHSAHFRACPVHTTGDTVYAKSGAMGELDILGSEFKHGRIHVEKWYVHRNSR